MKLWERHKNIVIVRLPNVDDLHLPSYVGALLKCIKTSILMV